MSKGESHRECGGRAAISAEWSLKTASLDLRLGGGREGATHTSERRAFQARERASAKVLRWESTGMNKEGQCRILRGRQEPRDQILTPPQDLGCDADSDGE